MDIIEKKFHKGVGHDGCPGKVAAELFQSHDFGELKVVDFDGAESLVSPGSPVAEASIRFYVAGEDDDADSLPMKFLVEFSPQGAETTVYSL